MKSNNKSNNYNGSNEYQKAIDFLEKLLADYNYLATK